MPCSRLKLSVAADGMTAIAEVSPGPACELSELQDAVRAAGVVLMLDDALLRALAEQLKDTEFAATEAVVAYGQPPVNGVDGYFEPAFPVGIQPGRLNADGTMDFFDRELLKPIAQGEYIGQLHKAVSGVPGYCVDGRELNVPAVRPSKLRPGPGVSMSDDGRMHAAHAGVLVYAEDQLIDVAQQHVHNGDVDLHSGSLHMEGSINLRGSVQRQFAVRATGNIDIHGHVDGGSVLSAGAIRVDGRVRSGDSGLVCAEGDVSLRHAEAARVRCGGLLKLQTSVNSELQASVIQLLGSMRGGSATSETSTVVNEAGSARTSTATLVAAGVPLERPLSDVRLAIEAAKQRRALTHQTRGADERNKGGKLGRANAVIEQKALARKAELAARRRELLTKASVEILTVAHAGVTVQLGVHNLQLEDPVTRARFVYDAAERQIRKEGLGK